MLLASWDSIKTSYKRQWEEAREIIFELKLYKQYVLNLNSLNAVKKRFSYYKLGAPWPELNILDQTTDCLFTKIRHLDISHYFIDCTY